VVLASSLVLAFGGVALRTQRKELDLARELAIAELRTARDERLVRADKLATMGALATGIAHEVATPVGVIMGRAEQLLPKVEGDERATRSVNAILEQTERIRRIIGGFLGLVRGETPPHEHVTPASIVRETVDLVEHRFTKAAVVLRASAGDDLPKIACEPRLFEQAIVNLLLNACDACEAGGVVTLDVEAEGDRVTFIVTDDGAGIAPEDAARAAEPFFTTKPPGQGTGLGLAIATEIVKHHYGTLTIGRALAKAPAAKTRGTVVKIEVPAVKEEAR
jgi:signal transduction histidine kinase